MKNIITFSFILISTFIFAQEKQVTADSLFDRMEYAEAAKLYEIEIIENGESKNYLEKIGDSYYFNTDMASANNWYGRLIASHKDVVLSKYLFRYAQTFKGLGNKKAAKKWMDLFVDRKDKEMRGLAKNGLTTIYFFENQSDLALKVDLSDFRPIYHSSELL